MAKARTKAQASTKGANAPAPGKRNGLVQQEILEHATRLFALRGYAGTSLQDIADAVGLTRPALYYYVKGKDELLAKLVAEITEESAASIGAIARRADLDPAAKLRAIVKASVQRQAEHAARFRLLLLSEAELPAEIAAAHEAGRRAVLKSIAGVINRGVEEGVFRPVDARIVALGVLGMNNWVAWWFTPDRDRIETVAEELADLAVASLLDAPDRAVAEPGPAGVLKLLRHDLDRLERML
jgi:AcrR family transcriptional regulator